MKESPEFIGRHYDGDEKKDLRETLRRWSDEALKPIEGEVEKKQEEAKIIETINFLIKKELQSLGIEDYEPIPLEKVHLLPSKIFKEKFPEFDGQAFFLSTSDVVYMNKDQAESKARIFSRLLHELIHRASTNKFYADKDKKDGGIYDARLGYHIRSPWKKLERENRLLGFNELMTDYTVYKILLKNQQGLENDFGITKEDIQGSIYTYMHYGPILESIINKIAEDKGISTQEVFIDLERGLFQPSILVLKDVERSFEAGALKILSYLETLVKSEDNEHLEEMIKKFFTETDKNRRQRLKSEIEEFIAKSTKST
ncbi:MAG TPA: hypothetical protein VK675_02970 [Candidatus Paceibacterota bacterium]|nr:hypothetical protein [Candidatus Paceibacterota bacterium]